MPVVILCSTFYLSSCIQVQYADLADVLSGFCVTEQLELKGIHFDLSVAEAFAQTEHSFGSECEITVCLLQSHRITPQFFSGTTATSVRSRFTCSWISSRSLCLHAFTSRALSSYPRSARAFSSFPLSPQRSASSSGAVFCEST